MIAINSELFQQHIRLYKGYGSDFSYFDSFHAALAKCFKILLVTSDSLLLEDKTIPTKDLKGYIDHK